MQLSANTLFTFTHAAAQGSASLDAEVAAFDARTGLLFVAGAAGIDVLDPASGALLGTIATGAYGLVNSIAVRDGVLAIAAEAVPKTDPGLVAVLDITRSGAGFTAAERFTVQVGALPDQISFTLDGTRLLTANEGSGTTSAYGIEAGVEAVDRAANFAAVVQALEGTYANSVALSSGDNLIPGPFTAAGTDAGVRDELVAFYQRLLGVAVPDLALDFNRVDIAIMNALGMQASALGNHEFDLGTPALLNAINFASTAAGVNAIGAQFPYLSANLDFSGDGGLAANATAELLDAASFAARATTAPPAGTARAASSSARAAAPTGSRTSPIADRIVLEGGLAIATLAEVNLGRAPGRRRSSPSPMAAASCCSTTSPATRQR